MSLVSGGEGNSHGLQRREPGVALKSARDFLTGYSFPVGLLVLLTFCMSTGAIQEGDLFWHLRTGEWIVENHRLPVSDLFSYTTPADSPMVTSLLRRYWLGQIALYGVWQIGGPEGIVLLRALTYVAIIGILCLWSWRRSQGLLPLLGLALTALLLREFTNERPQLFSFLLTPLVLAILDTRRGLVALPLIMLLWSNMHGGYLLGSAVILLFLGCEILGGRDRRFLLYLGLALVASMFNPSGWRSLAEFLSTQTSYRSALYEHLSPLRAALGMHHWFPAYWVALVTVLALVALRWRELATARVLAALSLAALSLNGLRFIAFLPMALPLLQFPENWRPRKTLPAVALLAAVALTVPWKECFQFGVDPSFPERAVGFAAKAGLPGRLFNFYDWGGYLIWRLREAPVFVDGRTLDEKPSLEYERALWSDNSDEVLDRYGIRTIILPGVSPSVGRIFPLILRLAQDPRWLPVYADETALVLCRDTDLPTLPRRVIFEHVASRCDSLLAAKPAVPAPFLVSLGAARFWLGDRSGAAAALGSALQLDPENQEAKAVMKWITPTGQRR